MIHNYHCCNINAVSGFPNFSYCENASGDLHSWVIVISFWDTKDRFKVSGKFLLSKFYGYGRNRRLPSVKCQVRELVNLEESQKVQTPAKFFGVFFKRQSERIYRLYSLPKGSVNYIIFYSKVCFLTIEKLVILKNLKYSYVIC